MDEATEFFPDGTVGIIAEYCIACGSCEEAVLMTRIFYQSAIGAYLKCDLCQGSENGPMCVWVCPTGALENKSVPKQDENK